MLFDERDLNIFESSESRNYFKEILQSYYGQNYRATIVMLYSFVIYDLFMKLQMMANEGDGKASNKLREINTMISDDEKYSKVENEVIQFFKDNCPLYFERFVEDIDYLRNCRNKCAHLKVNDNSLYVPSDYHARMLICSMFDNVLSVKAPFIMDLFTIAQSDVEAYSSSITYIPDDGLDTAICKAIRNKYLKRMTYDSIKKSYRTFIKLMFVSGDENCEQNAYGLFAFVYAMTDYIVKEGYMGVFSENSIIDTFSRIVPDTLRPSPSRRNALIAIMTGFPVIMDLIRSNEPVFEYISNCVLLKPEGLKHYRVFYPRDSKSLHDFFLENETVQQAYSTEILYSVLKDCDGFNLDSFMKLMVSRIPTFNGFDAADSFMRSMLNHVEELSVETIKEIMRIYRGNGQCVNRARHSSDVETVRKYLASRTEGNDNPSDSEIES